WMSQYPVSLIVPGLRFRSKPYPIPCGIYTDQRNACPPAPIAKRLAPTVRAAEVYIPRGSRPHLVWRSGFLRKALGEILYVLPRNRLLGLYGERLGRLKRLTDFRVVVDGGSEVHFAGE